jgi:hypothetical protein
MAAIESEHPRLRAWKSEVDLSFCGATFLSCSLPWMRRVGVDGALYSIFVPDLACCKVRGSLWQARGNDAMNQGSLSHLRSISCSGNVIMYDTVS